MAVLATYNVKGGVGKTATVVNLAHRAALGVDGDTGRVLVFELDAFLKKRKERSPLVLPFFSMVDRRKRLHRELIDDLCLAHPDILRAAVPSSAAVERMGAHQSPVAAFDRRSTAVAAYADLWDEVRARLAAAPGGPASATARSRAQA